MKSTEYYLMPDGSVFRRVECYITEGESCVKLEPYIIPTEVHDCKSWIGRSTPVALGDTLSIPVWVLEKFCTLVDDKYLSLRGAFDTVPKWLKEK